MSGGTLLLGVLYIITVSALVWYNSVVRIPNAMAHYYERQRNQLEHETTVLVEQYNRHKKNVVALRDQVDCCNPFTGNSIRARAKYMQENPAKLRVALDKVGLLDPSIPEELRNDPDKVAAWREVEEFLSD